MPVFDDSTTAGHLIDKTRLWQQMHQWPQAITCHNWFLTEDHFLKWAQIFLHVMITGLFSRQHYPNSNNITDKIDGLAQGCGNSSANALEILQSCAKSLQSPHLQMMAWCCLSLRWWCFQGCHWLQRVMAGVSWPQSCVVRTWRRWWWWWWRRWPWPWGRWGNAAECWRCRTVNWIPRWPRKRHSF